LKRGKATIVYDVAAPAARASRQLRPTVARRARLAGPASACMQAFGVAVLDMGSHSRWLASEEVSQFS
jgi:hypothetical protein